MKKVLFASGVAVLALVSIAGAQGYTFSSNLTVGSTGPAVTALQTALMSAGYNIPSIASGAASKGYFGSQTQAAVKLYQAARGIPNTGFVGPLTRGALNGGTAVVTGPMTCPLGYTCTLNGGGNIAPGQVTTTGMAGTLAVSLWSTPSGVNVYKGQSYDIAGYKLQAAASDMRVTSFSVDFDTRLWLYANSITLKDETGAVVGSVSNLGSSNFSELTVGSDYRVSVPVNFVVKAASSKYITVSVGFNAISDRSTGTLTVTSAQVRAVDGTGVTDTETVDNDRTFTYNGSNIGQVFVTTDPNSPSTSLTQISTSVQTQNILLGIFDVKAANAPATMQSLVVQVRVSKGTVSGMISNLTIKVGGLSYSADEIVGGTTASSTVYFRNMQVPLAADVYTPVSLYVTAAADTGSTLNGTSASSTVVGAGLAGGSTNNPAVIDMTYNNLLVNTATITTNDITFTTTGVTVPSLSTTYGSKTCNDVTSTCTQAFTWTFTLQAGNNPIYILKDVFTALATSTKPAGFTFVTQDFSDSNTSGDTVTAFYVAPGQTKTFTASFQATASSSAAGNMYVSSVQYGTSSSGLNSFLQTPDISNLLKAVLFH